MTAFAIGASVALLLLGVALISGRAIGPGGLIERDRWPQRYWPQVIALAIVSLCLLGLALAALPDLQGATP